jgi:hypothetical protein
MVANCHALVEIAMAPARSCGGTRFGNRDCDAGPMKARAMPNRRSSAKIAPTDRPPNTDRASSPATAMPSTTWQIAKMARRLKRSAVAPVTSTRSGAGANWISPTRPRSNGLWVRS